MWLQIAGALAEAGVGLKEITERVTVAAKAMGECPPGSGAGGRRRLPGDGACPAVLQGWGVPLGGGVRGTGSLGPQSQGSLSSEGKRLPPKPAALTKPAQDRHPVLSPRAQAPWA